MKRVRPLSDGTLQLPPEWLEGTEEFLLLESAEAIVVKKVRRSVAEKTFEEVAAPFRQMARDLEVKAEEVERIIDEQRQAKRKG
ncbi:hypothetical protein FJZ31_32560 [Candidatus Poribacteria bacterium]|nr:hypothetical protein [Candidatus Poribacteria bacterium]